jgi:hypothetical protein
LDDIKKNKPLKTKIIIRWGHCYLNPFQYSDTILIVIGLLFT